MTDPPAPLDVLIVGAGISGIGMAAHLARALPGRGHLRLPRRPPGDDGILHFERRG